MWSYVSWCRCGGRNFTHNVHFLSSLEASNVRPAVLLVAEAQLWNFKSQFADYIYIYGVWCAWFLVSNDVHPPESYGYESQAWNPCSSQMAMIDGNHRRPQMEPVFSGPIADLRRCFLSAGRRCENSMPFIQKLWPLIAISIGKMKSPLELWDKAIFQLE